MISMMLCGGPLDPDWRRYLQKEIAAITHTTYSHVVHSSNIRFLYCPTFHALAHKVIYRPRLLINLDPRNYPPPLSARGGVMGGANVIKGGACQTHWIMCCRSWEYLVASCSIEAWKLDGCAAVDDCRDTQRSSSPSLSRSSCCVWAWCGGGDSL